ncbi:MAG: NAD-dependent epimerase/dehydratase family protein [Candidatus Promineifilaceae bacterium]|nr:NAD-dependent epimerase/dehydratase family protein [Candidatus Promineifilaceae bacterium]
MNDTNVILVTGVAGYWGGRVARRLLNEPDLHVIGLDTEPPENVNIEALDYVQADVRNPLLPDLLNAAGVDAVCHLAFIGGVRRNETRFDTNVMGAMKLIGACAESRVRRLVVKSSTMVYGANANNSAFLAEDAPLNGGRRYGYNRYRLEIEAFINGFRRQAPELEMTVLRFANVVGPTADTPFNRYLRGPIAPVLLGFDPLLQVTHEDDVVEALAHATLGERSGPINVAADPPMPLLRILALAGRVPLPIAHPLAYQAVRWLGSSRLGKAIPFEPDYLRYRWVADTERMREELDFFPQFSGDEAVETVGTHLRLERYKPTADEMAYDEERLQQTIARRRQSAAAEEAKEVENG